MDTDILDAAQLLLDLLEEKGYSLVNKAGFKNIEIMLFENYKRLVVENCTANPPIEIVRDLD